MRAPGPAPGAGQSPRAPPAVGWWHRGDTGRWHRGTPRWAAAPLRAGKKPPGWRRRWWGQPPGGERLKKGTKTPHRHCGGKLLFNWHSGTGSQCPGPVPKPWGFGGGLQAVPPALGTCRHQRGGAQPFDPRHCRSDSSSFPLLGSRCPAAVASGQGAPGPSAGWGRSWGGGSAPAPPHPFHGRCPRPTSRLGARCPTGPLAGRRSGCVAQALLQEGPGLLHLPGNGCQRGRNPKRRAPKPSAPSLPHSQP